MQTIAAGGVRLECRWWGAPDCAGPTLVLLHEGLGCVAMWRDFPDRLHRRTGLRVFAWSRAGYGGSDPAGLPRQADYMHVEGREVAGAVLDAAGIDDAVLVGHSDGASVAIVHAGTHANHPARRVHALVLIAPHVFCEDVSIESIRTAGHAYRNDGLRDRLARYHGEQVTTRSSDGTTPGSGPSFGSGRSSRSCRTSPRRYCWSRVNTTPTERLRSSMRSNAASPGR